MVGDGGVEVLGGRVSRYGGGGVDTRGGGGRYKGGGEGGVDTRGVDTRGG